jgi:hypothetical protein
LAVSETGEFVLHAEYEKLELQHWIALMALEQFSTAELSEANCASVDVANRRIRNTANKALEEMAALEIRQKKS